MRKEYILKSNIGTENMYSDNDMEIIQAVTKRMLLLKEYKDKIGATNPSYFIVTQDDRFVCNFMF